MATRSLTHHIGFTLGRQLLAAGIQLVTVLVIARWLGPQGNGQYAMSVLLPTFLSTLLNLGVPAANVYFIGRGDAETKLALRSNLRFWVVLSIFGLFTSIVVVMAFSEEIFPDVPTTLIFLGLVAFPPALLQSFLASILQGLQDFRRLNAALLVGPISSFVLVLTALIFLDAGVLGALSAFVGGQVFSLIVTYALLRQSSTRVLSSTASSSFSYSRSALSYGWKAHLSNILAFVNYKADIFLVNFFLDPAATGIYVIAVQLAERLWMLSQAVSTVLLPHLAEQFKTEPSRNNVTPIAARWVFLLTSTAAIFLAIAAYPLIWMLFGHSYIDALQPLLALLPGIALGSFSRVLANDIAARGRPDINMYLSAVVVIINLAANMVLIPMLGLIGAAVATTLAYSVNTVVRLLIYCHLSHVSLAGVFAFSTQEVTVILSTVVDRFKRSPTS